jgi:hypothetical protein
LKARREREARFLLVYRFKTIYMISPYSINIFFILFAYDDNNRINKLRLKEGNNMFKLTIIQRSLLTVAAIGTLGLAIYGIFHTVSAFADSGNSLLHVNVNTANGENIKPDGALCNPYGCSGCSGCVSLQYQQNMAERPGAITDIQVE